MILSNSKDKLFNLALSANPLIKKTANLMFPFFFNDNSRILRSILCPKSFLIRQIFSIKFYRLVTRLSRGIIGHSQANLGMSYSYQSRNVLFWGWGLGGRGKWKEPGGRLEFPSADTSALTSSIFGLYPDGNRFVAIIPVTGRVGYEALILVLFMGLTLHKARHRALRC